MRREVEWAGKGGGHVVDKDQKSYLITIHQISPSGSPSCPPLPQAHPRACHHYHHLTHFRLAKFILMVVNRPAIYTCNFVLQPPKFQDSHCHSFFKKRRLSCYPFRTPDRFSQHCYKVLHYSKTPTATPWRCYGARSAPCTTCSRIQNKTLQ